ncbi:MAG: hypothetical protein OJF60_000712 [Burkholderiaceae bacterium]|nr:MAG: hypothetical protein OJF60_000712 [Burkholderiaceae bacterium]
MRNLIGREASAGVQTLRADRMWRGAAVAAGLGRAGPAEAACW